jgi:hypothetical protein
MSYLGNIKTAIKDFLQTFRTKSTHISLRKNLAKHWDLPNTGIFYSKDVAFANTVTSIENMMKRSSHV